MQVGLGPGHILLDGDCGPSSSSPKGAQPPPNFRPQFSAHICCGHMAAWIKMSLGMEVGLGPDNFVLDGTPLPSPKRGRNPQILDPCLLWPNGWVDQDGTWHGGRPQPRELCVRWRPSPPPPNFRPMFIVSCRTRVKRLYACAQIHY